MLLINLINTLRHINKLLDLVNLYIYTYIIKTWTNLCTAVLVNTKKKSKDPTLEWRIWYIFLIKANTDNKQDIPDNFVTRQTPDNSVNFLSLRYY